MNVLLLEPFTELRVMLRGVIQSLGVKNLYEPRNTMEAVQILAENQIDIMLCARDMQPFNGVLLIKMIRNCEEERIRTLRSLLSADTLEEDKRQKIMDVGTDAILQRPFSADDVKTLIMKIINNRAPFLETKNYTGPSRRKHQITYEFDDRRNEMFNPGRGVYKRPLMKMAFQILNARMKAQEERLTDREKELSSKGGIIIDRTMDEKNISLLDAAIGMTLSRPIKTDNGTLIMPTFSVLDDTAIHRIRDLFRKNRIDEGIWIQSTKAS